jgi:hypothetical protein
MTKKHFIVIAKSISAHRVNLSNIADKKIRDASHNVLDDVVRDLGIVLADTNPNFDWHRFSNACNLPGA